MALIPSDVGIRMRMETESQLQPLAPVRGIQSDLPDLQPGQAFSARIQQVMPDNTYRALVAGKEITLSLPQGAKAGDSLELVVTDRTTKAVMAQLATPPELKPGIVFTAMLQEALPENTFRALVGDKSVTVKLDVPAKAGDHLELTVIDRSSRLVEAHVLGRAGAGAAALPYEFTSLSPAAQLIGKLLVGDGQSPEAAPLNRGQPILGAPPQTGAELAPKLAQAVKESGLFYEAHQSQWVAGKLPAEALLKEPQGQQSTLQAFLRPETAAEAKTAPTATATTTTPFVAERIPDALQPLVQQQLDAAATQRMLWHGEVWPQQNMDWEIQRDAPERSQDGQELEAWSTRLALTTPRLGRVEASLQLVGGSLRVALNAADETSAENLRQGATALSKSLDAAGVPLVSFLVRHGE